MASSVEDAFGLARLAEERLYGSLSREKIDSVTVSEFLEQYCKSGSDVIFNSYPTELAREVEEKLWAAHSKVNNHFRRTISKLQRNKNKPVETRKVLKRYLEFLKSSQRFYRAYILRLDQSYGGIAELRQVAKNWSTTGETTSTAPLTTEKKQFILQSCFKSLVHLGDLCRYREIEINKGQRNWGPAIGYYSLANEVLPQSGIAHNQLAVVALADGNHLRAVYYLFRSLATKNPHPSAQSNLELEFKKVITAWDKGERIVKRPQGEGHPSVRSLIAWFVRLHSKCYKGQDFPEHAELMQEILSQLHSEIRDHASNGKLQMLILINIASEYFAANRLQQNLPTEENFKAYFFYLEINVRFFRSLLALLQSELQELSDDGPGVNNMTELALSAKLSLVTKTLLPVLRIYSTWLTVNWAVFTAGLAQSTLGLHIDDFWSTYAQVLSLLAVTFPTKNISKIDYMLEEDVDTISFVPLIKDKTTKIWMTDDGPRQKFSDAEVERLHPDIEMLGRIRGLLVDSLQIVVQDESPLTFQNMQFNYEQKAKMTNFSATDQLNASSPILTVTQSREVHNKDSDPLQGNATVSVDANKGPSTSLTADVAMSRMVDDLVGPSNDSIPTIGKESAIPPSPPEQTFEDTALVDGLNFGMSQLSTMTVEDKLSNTNQTKMTSAQAGSHSSPAGVSPPPIKTLATLPLLLDQSGIWNSKAELTVPSSPFLEAAAAVATTQYSQSPVYLGGDSPAHSRNPSLTSIGSGHYAASGAWSPLLSMPNLSTSVYHPQYNPSAHPQPQPRYHAHNLQPNGSQYSLTDLRESYIAYGRNQNQNLMQPFYETSGFASSATGSSPQASAYAAPSTVNERIPDRHPSSPYPTVAAANSDFSPWNSSSDSRRVMQKSSLGHQSMAYRQEG